MTRKGCSLAACAAALFSAMTAPAGGQDPSGRGAGGLEIGDSAVDFALPGTDGKTHRLADFAGPELLVIVFTCNHCPTAQAYEERLAALVEKYDGKGVAFVAISPNDPRAVRLDELGYTDVSDTLADMKIRAEEKKFRFPYLYDGDEQKVSRAYGPTATPHVFVFDTQRKLRYSGRIDDSESGKDIKSHDARNAIEALLGGMRVPVETTRVFGCSIKWSDKRDANRTFLEKLAAEKVGIEDVDLEDINALRKNESRKLRLINVWASWCGPCRTEFPDLVEANRMYRHRDFEFVSISVDSRVQKDRALEVLEKAEASNRNFLYGDENLDALGDALDPAWSGALPLTILIEPGGEIRYRHEGPVDPLALRREIVGYLGRTYR